MHIQCSDMPNDCLVTALWLREVEKRSTTLKVHRIIKLYISSIALVVYYFFLSVKVLSLSHFSHSEYDDFS